MNSETSKKIIPKLNESFINDLISKQENYTDDIEVSREINNLLNAICLKSEDLSGKISK